MRPLNEHHLKKRISLLQSLIYAYTCSTESSDYHTNQTIHILHVIHSAILNIIKLPFHYGWDMHCFILMELMNESSGDWDLHRKNTILWLTTPTELNQCLFNSCNIDLAEAIISRWKMEFSAKCARLNQYKHLAGYPGSTGEICSEHDANINNIC